VNVAFINDSTSNPNWGDRAAAISLMAMVETAGGRIAHAVTEDALRASIFTEKPAPVGAGSPETLTHRAIRLCVPPLFPAVGRRLRRRPDDGGPSGLIPQEWGEFERAAEAAAREPRYGWPVLLSALGRADLVVIHGDGAMVGNDVIPRTDLFLAYIAKRRLGRPVIIVNHTADFDHPDLRGMAEHVYPLFDDVVFRDPVSAERCASFCACRYAPDTAFAFQPAARDAWASLAGRPTFFDIWPDTASFDPARPYLCVGGSSLVWAAWDPDDMTAGLVDLVRGIRSIYPGQVVLTASDVAEHGVFAAVAAELGLPLIGVTTPVQQAVDILGNADAYVGGRWHPSIFALRGGAPVVALDAKTFKMRALLDSAGLPSRTFDVRQGARDAPALLGLLADHLEQGAELRRRLRAWAEEQAKASVGNVRYLEARP